MAELKMWTVARYPDGSWTYGGRPDSPDYEFCEVWRIAATDEKAAVRKAQAKRRRAIKKGDTP